jgi:hypothetical protein
VGLKKEVRLTITCRETMMDQIVQLGGKGRLPTFIIQDPFRKTTFPLDDSGKKLTDADKFESWVTSFFAKKLISRTKSEPTHKKVS